MNNQIRRKNFTLFFIVALSALSCTTLKLQKATETPSTVEIPTRDYFFGWPEFSTKDLPIRGGTTTGVPVLMDTLTSPFWTNLQLNKISGLAKDQAAIRALSGEFKVSFDFMETILFGDVRIPSTPYRSWGTEKVYILDDQPGLIELQHILVMSFMDDKNELQGPFVMKHWRQKWEANPNVIHQYIGNRTWISTSLESSVDSDIWTQTVYQVDDSPRYSLKGAWKHYTSHSEWTSKPGHRPLPRREYSYRSDYETLFGTNRITVVPNGWIHEQDNLKTSLNNSPTIAESNLTFLAREIGLNRYTRITQYDFKKGDEYLKQTGDFCKIVRDQWKRLIYKHPRITVKTECEGQPAYQAFFELASKFKDSKTREESAIEKNISEAITCLTTTQ